MRHCYEPDREFDSEMDTIICNSCIHKQPSITCAAFPDGIPEYILRNGQHFTPVPGDGGIVYSPKSKTTSCNL